MPSDYKVEKSYREGGVNKVAKLFKWKTFQFVYKLICSDEWKYLNWYRIPASVNRCKWLLIIDKDLPLLYLGCLQFDL